MNARSLLFLKSPDWFHPGTRHIPRIAPEIESWLFEAGSLTRRLRDLCGSEFRLRLLRQDSDRPFPDETRALGLRQARRALVREVLLQRGERPLVAARSIIPVETLRGAQRGLARLGARPLGEILFRDPRLERAHFELAKIDPRIWRRDLAHAAAPGVKVWGRRSLYTIGPGRLLVAEFFLPALFDPGCEPC